VVWREVRTAKDERFNWPGQLLMMIWSKALAGVGKGRNNAGVLRVTVAAYYMVLCLRCTDTRKSLQPCYSQHMCGTC